MEYAGISKEVVVVGNGERIEIWDGAKYQQFMEQDVEFASLSEEVMGGLDHELGA